MSKIRQSDTTDDIPQKQQNDIVAFSSTGDIFHL